MAKAQHIFLVFLLLILNHVTGFSQVIIKYSDATGDLADNVVVDVTVDGFTDVRNFNFLTHWDDNLLEYVSIDNVNPIFPMAEIDFGTPDITGKTDRVIAALIQFGTPVEYSLGPNDILFSITLKVISPLCTSSAVDTLDILPKNEFVIFENGSEIKVKPGSSPGEVDINPGCGSGNLLGMGSAEGLPGAEVCVPLYGKDLTDLGGYNGLLLNWDPTILTYTRMINKTANQGTPIINDNNAATGELQMIYSYVGPGGIGLSSDSTALYCLCFTVVGECDASAQLTLSEAPTFGIFNSSNDPIDHDLSNGEISVNCCEATATIDHVTCAGGSDGGITLTPAGCMNITSVDWSNTTQTGIAISNIESGSYDVTITYNGGTSTRVITGLEVDEPTPIVLTSSSITKVVNGGDGAINIEVEGGTPDYTFNWSNNAATEDLTGIDVGDYSVTVTDDNNCIAAFGPFTVATAPSISGVVTDVICFGSATGAVDITVTGGSIPYSYAWSCSGNIDPSTGDISNLLSGICSVTVTDANDCATTMSFEINGPASAIDAVATVVDDVSNDGNGSISLVVTGGWGDYHYTWSDGISTDFPDADALTGLFGGNYSVTITDANGCEAAFGPFTVSGLHVIATNIDAVQCFGDNSGAIDILVTGGSGTYTYDWSCNGNVDANGNISGLTAGTCTLVVTDVTANRTTMGTFEIPGPSEALVVSVEMTCAEDDDGSLVATISGGVPPVSYVWNTNPVQTGSTATGLSEGEYSVLITDSAGCQVMSIMSVRNCARLDCYTAMDVITPNGDGKNDLFIIDCADDTNNKLRIFTRWGQEVIEFDNYQNDWDGYDEGRNLVDEDTYMWVLEVFPTNGNTELYTGAVSVIYKLR